MSNSFTVTQYITNYAIAQFVNNIQFTKMASRKFEKFFTTEKYASGQTVNIRLTNNFIPGFGPTVTPNGVQDRYIPLVIEEQINGPLSFDSQELTLDVKSEKSLNILDMYVKPYCVAISNAADLYQISKLLTINNFVGTAGTLVNSIDIVNNASANLTARGVPLADRYCGVNIPTGASIKNSMKANFTPNINEGVVKTGFIADIYGIEFFETANLGYHTSGTGGGGSPTNGLIPSGTVLAPVSSGNTITITGLPVSTTGVFLAGDIIQLAITQSVNLVTLQPTGNLMSFSVLANVNSDSSGHAVVTVNPSIISDNTSPYMNVSNVIGAGENVNLVASHNVGYLLHKDALQTAMPMMKELGAGVDTSYARFDEKHSLSLRYSEGSIILNDLNVKRLDMLIGSICLSDYGCRIVG